MSLIDFVVSSVEKESWSKAGSPENIECGNTLTIVGTCLKLGGLAKTGGVSLEFACWTLSIGATSYKYSVRTPLTSDRSKRACILKEWLSPALLIPRTYRGGTPTNRSG